MISLCKFCEDYYVTIIDHNFFESIYVVNGIDTFRTGLVTRQMNLSGHYKYSAQ